MAPLMWRLMCKCVVLKRTLKQLQACSTDVKAYLQHHTDRVKSLTHAEVPIAPLTWRLICNIMQNGVKLLNGSTHVEAYVQKRFLMHTIKRSHAKIHAHMSWVIKPNGSTHVEAHLQMMKNEVQLRNGSTHVEAYVQKDAQWMLEANWESFLLIGGGLQNRGRLQIGGGLQLGGGIQIRGGLQIEGELQNGGGLQTGWAGRWDPF